MKILFGRNAQGVSKIHQEELLLMRFLQTKPQVKIRKLIIMFYITLLLKIEMKKRL